MIPLAVITFRESLEVLFVIGFLFTSLGNHKSEKKGELLIGAVIGLCLTITLFLLSTYATSHLGFRLEHETGEVVEGVNYLGSGIFLYITAVLLHAKIKTSLSKKPLLLLDTSLIVIGFLSVIREGIEIVLFTIPTSLSQSFTTSLIGFSLGIFLTIACGMMGSKIIAMKFSSPLVLKISDWGIKILSLYFAGKGLIILFGHIFRF